MSIQKQAAKILKRRALEAKAKSGSLEDHEAHYKMLKSLENTAEVKRQTQKNKRLLKKYPL